MYRLPVSGLRVDVRPPGGTEDLSLLDAPALDRAFAIDFLRRLSDIDDPECLCVHDFEAMLLHLHRTMFGRHITATAVCKCGKSVDVDFLTADFLAHRAPRRPRGVRASPDAGWYSLQGDRGAFRLPTVGDQIAVAGEKHPAAALQAACMRDVASPVRAESAMAALAPQLSGPIQGSCPYCARSIVALFDVVSYVLGEMQIQASLVCEDVHLLATHYHWSEESILALPNWRRQRYVGMVASERGG